jgi:hypothetical protein
MARKPRIEFEGALYHVITRGEELGRGRRVVSLVAKEYGYKAQELAGYLWRDPSVITRYLKEGNRLGKEVENVHAKLWENSNKQV